MKDEDDIERELREADALARALERGHAHDELPEDALQMAALIRYSRDGGALAPDREDAVLGDVLAAADRLAARSAPAPSKWRWLLGSLGLAGLAALLLFVVRPSETSTALPAPSAHLVEAQLARHADPSAEARWDAEMRAYRGEIYAALEQKYGNR